MSQEFYDGNNKKNLFSFLKGLIKTVKNKRKLSISILIVIVLFIVGRIGYGIWLSKQPQPILVTSFINKPQKNDYNTNTSFPLLIKFNGSVAKLESIGKIQSEGLTITPSINGTWLWEKDNELKFTPEELWEIGTEYKITVDKEIFPEHIEVKKLTHKFQTESFTATLKAGEFYIDPENSKIKRVLSQVNFNYPVDTENLKDMIMITPDLKRDSGSLKNQPHGFDLSISDDRMIAYIVSEPVGMPANNVDMKITLKSGIRSSYGGNGTKNEQTKKVTVPGASNFVKVKNLSVSLVKDENQVYEQVLILETKGEINWKTLIDNIEIWELPRDRPELPGLRRSTNHNWKKTDEMVPEVLTLAKKISFSHIPNERDVSSINSLELDVKPNKYIYIKLKEGTRFYGDYFLSEDYKKILKVPEYPKEVSILSEGSLLSLYGDKKVTFLTRGISAINVEISRIRPDDLNHLVTQTNGRIENINFTNYNFSEDNISETYKKRISLNSKNDPKRPVFSNISLAPYLNTIPDKNLRNGIFILKVKDSNNSGRSDKRLIMVSDLGFLIKNNSDSSREIFVQSISSGLPVSSATVEIWGTNGNPIFKGATNKSGHIKLPSFNGYQNENRPTVFVIRKGNDLSFMPYNDNGQLLNYSNFDIGGVYGSKDANKLNAFLFSDRGIYRPGDKFNIAAIIKAGDWNINLQGTPLKVTITDPKGSEIHTQRLKLDASGFTEISYKTQDYSPTGTYKISLYANNQFLGSTSIKVEEFLPDTLKVNTTFTPSASAGWVSPEKLKGIISVKNLFGTPAAGNDIRLQLVLNPGFQRFTQFREYKFFDPYLKQKTYEEFLGNHKTDDDGEYQIDIDLSKFEQATYNVTLMTEAFEKNSGRNISNEASILVSPAKYLLGYRSDSTLSHINKNSERFLKFIAVDPELESITVNELRMIISETKYITSLIKQPNGVYKYQSKRKEYKIDETPLSVPKGGTEFQLPTSTDGEFSWQIIDKKDYILTSGNFSVIGEKNIERSLERSAELEISLNKEDFKPGEEIEVFIKGPYKGAGLITIERDKVYTHKWFKTDGESTTESIRVPNNLEGNGYISVTLVRSLDSEEIYMSPLSYGAVPFSISKDQRINHIEIDIPDEALPGEIFPITYKTSEPAKIVVYAVDMGILQVANYKTPKPISHFFKKRALEVQTSQILDLILPEFSIAQSLSAMGGGGGDEYLKNNINPFKRKNNKPVAYWSGIIDADQKERTLEYRVPEHFNGTLKVMAVAVSREKIGSTEKNSVIRSPFVIQPTVPTLSAPGDITNINVSVTNVKSGSGSDVPVTISVTPSEHIKVLSETTLTFNIDEGRDHSFTFKVETNNIPGAAELKFQVKGSGEEVSLSSYLSVRPSIPYRSFIDTGVVNKSEEKVTIEREIYDEFAKRDISVSYLPLGMALGLEAYLSDYPYGCTEQITSGAFPKLFPRLIKNLDKDQSVIDNEITSTISILQSRQKPDGSFGIWTSLSRSNYVVDNHVMYFLTLAREQGYYVPQYMMQRGLKNITSIARENSSSYNILTAQALAIYILSLNEVVTTSYIESLEKKLSKEKDWKNSYAGLYLAGSYSLLQQQKKAESIMKTVTKKMNRKVTMNYYDSVYYTALYLHILSKYTPDYLGKISEELLLDMAEELSNRKFSTYSAAMSLMAIESYLKVSPQADEGNYTVKELIGEKENSVSLTGVDVAKGIYNKKANEISISNESNLNLFYQVTNSGFNIKVPDEEHNNIELLRNYLDKKGKETNNYTLGDEVTVRLRFRTINDSTVSNVAIVDMIPSGFEIDIESVRKNSSDFKPDYVDIREDRIVLYGDFKKSTQEFTYKIRAINTGNFKVPPSFAEAMYDQDINSIKPINDIEITAVE